MPTINQLIRHGRKVPVARNKVPALEACPQKTRRMHAGVHYNAKEAELGPAQGRARV